MTILDDIHPSIRPNVQLDEDEFPVASFFAGDGDWTLYTTNHLIGEIDGARTCTKRSDFGSCDFGDFKQDLDSACVKRATMSCLSNRVHFLYESGYASMVPIYYFKFWSLKWPVWKETYRIERQQAEKSGGKGRS